MTRLLMIGVDGATFKLLGPWMDEGKLSHLREIRDNGVSGSLTSSIPPVTAPAWQCFMTGKNPGKHGVYWFMHSRPESYEVVPINSTDCDSLTFWELLSHAGYKVAALNIPGTYPPRRINGVMISGLLTPAGRRDFVYPPGLLEEIEGKFGPYRLKAKLPPFLANLSAATIAEFLRDCQEMSDYHFGVARYLMERQAFDYVMLHLLATDMIQHWLWHLLDSAHPRYDAALAHSFAPRLLGYYQHVDRQIGELWELAGQDTAVVILSDHGFGPLHKEIDLNVWLLREGYLQIRKEAAPRIKWLLWRLGWTPNAIYRGFGRRVLRLATVQRRLAGGQPARDAFYGRSRFTRSLGRLFLSAADIDWPRTRAYAPLGFGHIRVNLAGREPQGLVQPGRAYEALRDEIVGKLKALIDPETGTTVDGEVFIKEQAYQGKYLATLPDIIFLPLENGYVAANPATFLTNKIFSADTDLMATHRMQGILMVKGGPFRKGKTIEGAALMDLAPTLLYLMGTGVPADMDGRVLQQLFEESFVADHPIVYAAGVSQARGEPFEMSKADQEDVLGRLRGLGYID